MDLFSLKGHVALVTGSAQGLGNTIARGMLEAGATVVLSDVSQKSLEKAQEELRKEGHEVPAYVFDISDEPAVTEAVAAIEREVGPIDILVNNAGIHKRNLLIDMPVENWRKVIDVNLSGAFIVGRAVARGMIERRYGKIVSMSSSAVKSFIPGFGPYGATKGGIVVLTKTVNEEVKRFGINVNCINLGMTNTEKTRERIGADDPTCQWNLDEMLQVEDVAKVVTWLASDDAKPIMGAAIDCDGLIC